MFVYMGRTKIIRMLQLIRRTVSLTNPAHALRLVPSWLPGFVPSSETETLPQVPNIHKHTPMRSSAVPLQHGLQSSRL